MSSNVTIIVVNMILLSSPTEALMPTHTKHGSSASYCTPYRKQEKQFNALHMNCLTESWTSPGKTASPMKLYWAEPAVNQSFRFTRLHVCAGLGRRSTSYLADFLKKIMVGWSSHEGPKGWQMARLRVTWERGLMASNISHNTLGQTEKKDMCSPKGWGHRPPRPPSAVRRPPSLTDENCHHHVASPR